MILQGNKTNQTSRREVGGSKDKNQIIRKRTVGFSGFTDYTFKNSDLSY